MEVFTLVLLLELLELELDLPPPPLPPPPLPPPPALRRLNLLVEIPGRYMLYSSNRSMDRGGEGGYSQFQHPYKRWEHGVRRTLSCETVVHCQSFRGPLKPRTPKRQRKWHVRFRVTHGLARAVPRPLSKREQPRWKWRGRWTRQSLERSVPLSETSRVRTFASGQSECACTRHPHCPIPPRLGWTFTQGAEGRG